MIALWLLAAWSVSDAAAGECPSFEAAVTEAEGAVRAFRVVDADAALKVAITAVGCAPVDDPESLARLLRVVGARRLYDEDTNGAQRAFANAKALDPMTFERELWGDEALGLWFSTKRSEWGEGTLVLEGGDGVFVDGEYEFGPVRVAGVPHLLRNDHGEAWLVEVAPGASRTVRIGTPAPPKVVAAPRAVAAPLVSIDEPEVDLEPRPIATRRRHTGARVFGVLGGVVAAGVGTIVLGGAVADRGDLEHDARVGRLDADELRQDAYSINQRVVIGYGLVGVGVAAGAGAVWLSAGPGGLALAGRW